MKSRTTTIILVIVLALAGTAAYFASKKTSDTSSSLDTSDRNFAVEDASEIAKILLAQRNGKITKLEKIGGQWLVEGRYPVHPNVMSNMLDVLTRLELKYIPPRSAYDNMMKTIGRIGIKVEVYNDAGEQLQSYQVGGTTDGELGTVFLKDGYAQPYVMKMRNFEGSLRGRFIVNKSDDIRDRTVFAYEKEEVKEVSVWYPKDQIQSFRVVRQEDGGFELQPYSTDGYAVEGSPKAGAILNFVRAFQDVDAEAFENLHPLRDSISSLVPLAEISVTNVSDQKKSVKLFSVIDVFNQEVNTRSVGADFRVERYFADCSWGEFMIVQDLLFRKILWRYEEFY